MYSQSDWGVGVDMLEIVVGFVMLSAVAGGASSDLETSDEPKKISVVNIEVILDEVFLEIYKIIQEQEGIGFPIQSDERFFTLDVTLNVDFNVIRTRQISTNYYLQPCFVTDGEFAAVGSFFPEDSKNGLLYGHAFVNMDPSSHSRQLKTGQLVFDWPEYAYQDQDMCISFNISEGNNFPIQTERYNIGPLPFVGR